tara:strand:+ start:1449 stop:2027 length:579 start_codon:yes stop_codon:yes gene_type:complete
MAQPKRSAASYVAESRNTKKKNPFTGKTMAEMKKMWRGMTPAQRKANEKNFVNAAKTAPKAKPAAKSKPAASKPRQTTKEEAKSRFFRSSSGTRGQSRPSNSAGPAVRRQGSATGASVDPRERQLRKNRQEARRSTTGSSTAGRRNIARQVAEQSGSAKRNQRQVEARRRRAREEAAKRNRRLMLSRKFNKD